MEFINLLKKRDSLEKQIDKLEDKLKKVKDEIGFLTIEKLKKMGIVELNYFFRFLDDGRIEYGNYTEDFQNKTTNFLEYTDFFHYVVNEKYNNNGIYIVVFKYYGDTEETVGMFYCRKQYEYYYH